MPQIDVKRGKSIDGLFIQHVKYGYHSLSAKTFLAVILMCSMLSGCSNVMTIWSTAVQSPDGRWLAMAVTKQHSGPGNALLQTTVFLKHTKGPKEPIEIMLFTQDDKFIDLKLVWLTGSHLEVTYKQPATIDFQVVKCGGVDISVRELSAGVVIRQN